MTTRSSALAFMGVDHGGDGGTSPPEFGVGDANANCPPQILSYRYKMERSVVFKIRRNPFSAKALTRTPLGSSRRSPGLLEGVPSPYPIPLGTKPTFGAGCASSSEFQPIYAYDSVVTTYIYCELTSQYAIGLYTRIVCFRFLTFNF